jgi:hypothetical protein
MLARGSFEPCQPYRRAVPPPCVSGGKRDSIPSRAKDFPQLGKGIRAFFSVRLPPRLRLVAFPSARGPEAAESGGPAGRFGRNIR